MVISSLVTRALTGHEMR